jgi:D-amino peptidase
MKVFISADMEGTTGAVDWNDVMPGKRQYERFRRLLTGDVNAAIKGAVDAGADEILVNEAHDGMMNIFIEDLPQNASMITGHVGKREGMMEGIDETFDAVFLVAYHAMEGTTAAIMNHTMSPHLIRKVWLGDIKVGELGLSAIIAGHYNVPVVLVTGDDKIAKEATSLLGDIETAIVKYGISRYAARCLTPEKTASIIRESARRAVERRKKLKALKLKYPLEMKIELMTALQASQVSTAPGFNLVDPTTVSCTCSSALDVRQKFSELYRGRDRVFGPIPE